jgi:hypothetical protein
MQSNILEEHAVSTVRAERVYSRNTEMIRVRMWSSHTCRLQGRWPVRTNEGGRGEYTVQLWPIGMVNKTPLSKAKG